MTPITDQATDQAQTQGTRCSFCHAHLPGELAAHVAEGCHTCGASWRDHYVAELLMGFECLDGVRNFARLSQTLDQRGRQIAVIGRLFKRPQTKLLGRYHQYNAAQLRKITRRRLRLPARGASLDYLLVSDAGSMIFPLEEATRVLKDNGVLAVFWERATRLSPEAGIPDRTRTEFHFDAPLIDLSRQAGLVGWIERPGLGVSRIQHLQSFVAIKPPVDRDALARKSTEPSSFASETF